MSLSLYQASVPVFLRVLGVTSDLLTKGEAFAAEQGIDAQDIFDLRLAPDMFPFIRQVQTVSDSAKSGAARLAGIEAPAMPDTETSFAELQDRIAKTIAFVQSIAADQIDGGEDRPISFKAGPVDLKFTGQSFLFAFTLPNLYFHLSTAYGLLRQKGVPLGKVDFLGGMKAMQEFMQ